MELEITITPAGPVDLDTARRYAEVSVHRLTLHPPSTDDDSVEHLIATAGDTLAGQI